MCFHPPHLLVYHLFLVKCPQKKSGFTLLPLVLAPKTSPSGSHRQEEGIPQISMAMESVSVDSFVVPPCLPHMQSCHECVISYLHCTSYLKRDGIFFGLHIRNTTICVVYVHLLVVVAHFNTT